MIDKLKEKIDIAQEAVKDVKDPALKQKAFEVVLNNLLMENKNQMESCEEQTIKLESTAGEKNTLSNFLNAAGIKKEQLNNIVDFDGDSIRIIGAIPGNTDSSKQRNATLLILTIKHYVQNDREIPVPTLKKILQDLGIGSLVNLSTNLKGFENFIIMKGSKGSKSTAYRITNPGTTKGIELLKIMVV